MLEKLILYLRARKLKKRGREILRQAHHLRCYREDILPAKDLASLTDAETQLREAVAAPLADGVPKAAENVMRTLSRIAPRPKLAGWRENIEILVVAIAVAMGIRTYFIQPFKIPTGSMQPTLFGIHGVPMAGPKIIDRFPFSVVRWLITGERYVEVKVRRRGRLSLMNESSKPGFDECVVADAGYQDTYHVPREALIRGLNGKRVPTGQMLWRGRIKAGDHVFVNKVAWNFMKPKRGDVIVFSTSGIEGLPQGTHYIKRLCGLPTEKISISEPYVVANGVPVTEPASIARVASRTGGYAGYHVAQPYPDPYTQKMPLLYDRSQSIDLSDTQYLVLGDNTRNSRDSRYWGPVPRRNLVGPAFMVYWPFLNSRDDPSPHRWGLIKGH